MVAASGLARAGDTAKGYRNAWDLLPDDTYCRVAEPGEPSVDSHSIFMHDSFGLDELP